ncbi:MAG: hypothetical protein ACOZBH_04175 [Patescibacteria group bacterium]
MPKQTDKKTKCLLPCYIMLITAIITVATVIACVGYMWYFSLIGSPIQRLAENQTMLQNQVQKLAPEATGEAVSSVGSETRILLKPIQGVFQYNPTYEANLKASEMECELTKPVAADKVKTYFSQRTGSSFDIPYNADWVNSKYSLDPYDVVAPYDPNKRGVLGQVNFGPLVSSENCAWRRQYVLQFLDSMSAEDSVKDIDYSSITKITIKTEQGELKALKVLAEGMCGDIPMLIVLGPEYNYEFSGDCFTGTSNDFTVFESIMQTFRFTHGL